MLVLMYGSKAWAQGLVPSRNSMAGSQGKAETSLFIGVVPKVGRVRTRQEPVNRVCRPQISESLDHLEFRIRLSGFNQNFLMEPNCLFSNSSEHNSIVNCIFWLNQDCQAGNGMS
jgi:hypothetical protein